MLRFPPWRALMAPSSPIPYRVRDFTGGSAPPGLLFSRAGIAWSRDAAGLFQQAAAHVARYQRDELSPWANRGILVEGAGSNQIRNPRAEGGTPGTQGSGAVLPTNWLMFASPTNGVARDISFGVRNGVPGIYVRAYGTPSATAVFDFCIFEQNAGIAAANGERWHLGALVELIAAGTGLQNVSTVGFRVTRYNSVPTSLGSVSIGDDFVPTDKLLPYWAKYDTVDASLAYLQPRLRCGITNGMPVDVTLFVALPSEAKIPYPASPATPPAGAPGTSTRAADYPVLPFVLDPAAGFTVFFDFRLNGEDIDGGNDRVAAMLDNGSADDSVEVTARVAGTKTARVRTKVGGVTVADLVLPGPDVAANAAHRIAISMVNGVMHASIDGGAIAAATPASLPSFTTLRFGHSQTGNGGLNGSIARFGEAPQHISEARTVGLAAGVS